MCTQFLKRTPLLIYCQSIGHNGGYEKRSYVSGSFYGKILGKTQEEGSIRDALDVVRNVDSYNEPILMFTFVVIFSERLDRGRMCFVRMYLCAYYVQIL